MKVITLFEDFLKESLKQKKVNHIEDIEIKDGTDEKTEKEAQDFIEGDSCPRCGERPSDCKCESNDPWSTQNYHRVPKGNIKKGNTK
jgi:hypothetical protein